MTRARPVQREKAVQADCCKLLRSVGASVYVLGTRRRKGEHQGTMQTPGIPDVWFYLPQHEGRVFGDIRARAGWLECKSKVGRLSKPQRQFDRECDNAGVDHIVGGVDELIAYLVSVGRLKR